MKKKKKTVIINRKARENKHWIKGMVQMKMIKILFIACAIFLSACNNHMDTNMSEPMADFKFITQDEDFLSLEDLKGEWWITNLMYTNCKTVCPMTTANLAEVQQRLSEQGLNPPIVSFSVDPAHDTPEILKDYAIEHGADLDTWSFLTGYDFKMIQAISENSFKAVLREGVENQRSHGFNFYLVNPDGEIVKKYDGMSIDEIELLIDDVGTVL